jgi:hypothetical protein
MTAFSDIASEIVDLLYDSDDHINILKISKRLFVASGYGDHDWEDLLVCILNGFNSGNYKLYQPSIDSIKNELEKIRKEIYV